MISLASQHSLLPTMDHGVSNKWQVCDLQYCCAYSEAKRPSPLPLPILFTHSAVAVSGMFDAITAALYLQRACALGERMQLPALGLSTAPAHILCPFATGHQHNSACPAGVLRFFCFVRQRLAPVLMLVPGMNLNCEPGLTPEPQTLPP